MSSYRTVKVLRVPATEEQLHIKEDEFDDFERAFPDLTGWFTPNKFMVSATDRLFLDYVIESKYDYGCNDFAKIRNLYDSEIERFKPIFQKIIPSIDMKLVRVIEFCWYDCCEAPSYYEESTDDFYKEIIL